MIYSITGWNLQENGATKLTALLSAYTAIKLQKKTLVMQLTNPRKMTVETALVGKQLKQQKIDVLDSFSYSNEGTDAILRQAKYGELTEDSIQTAVTQLLNKERLLDLAKPSTKADFELEMEENIDVITESLKAVEKMYDYVFVLIPESNRSFCEKLYSLFTVNNIKCLPQCIPDRPVKNKNFTFVLPEYENRSVYTAASIKKELGLKSIYYFTRNVAFNDAVLAGNVLEYVQKNVDDDKSDDNYFLFECLHQFFLRGTKEKKEEEPEEIQDLAERICNALRPFPELDEVDTALHVTIKEEKKFLRRKKETISVDRSLSGKNDSARDDSCGREEENKTDSSPCGNTETTQDDESTTDQDHTPKDGPEENTMSDDGTALTYPQTGSSLDVSPSVQTASKGKKSKAEKKDKTRKGSKKRGLFF